MYFNYTSRVSFLAFIILFICSCGDSEDIPVIDNTIKYTLGPDDFSSIAEAFAGINSAGSDSMSDFGNYDLTLWSSDQIFESITARLLEIFPAVEGQKYNVSYSVWRPGSGVDEIKVIYDGSAYVLFVE